MNGLRALAALAIVLFHVDPAWLPGGFIGVDIFFVISGFLITGQIIGQGPAFSYRAFYRRRFLRLWPALAFTIIASLVAGWFILAPTDYAGMAKSALSGLTGVSNIYFLFTQDYFAPGALQKPLLHVWSLSVEEQFYLVWPMLLVLGRPRPVQLAVRLGLVFVLSVILSYVLTRTEPVAAYYLMPTRAFGFAIGGLLCLVSATPKRRVAELGTALGFGLIAFSFAQFSEHSAWPGLNALVPSMGTALLIWSRHSRLSASIFSLPGLGALGRASYSIYLVHWPVVSFTAYALIAPPSLAIKLALLPLILVLGFALHVLIEQPLRSPRVGETRRLSPLRQRNIAMASIMVAAVGCVAILGLAGVPKRFAKGQTQLPGELTFAGDACNAKFNRCAFGDPDAQRVVYLVGDSHALNLVAGLDRQFREWGIRGIGLYNHGCLFVEGSLTLDRGVVDRRCAQNVAATYDLLKRDRHPVLLAAAFRSYAGTTASGDGVVVPAERYLAWLGQGVQHSISALGARPIAILGPGYDAGVNIGQCAALNVADAACSRNSRQAMAAFAAPVEAALTQAIAPTPQVRLLPAWAAFCGTGEQCMVQKDGVYLFRDNSHLTNEGSYHLIANLRPALADWLGQDIKPAR